MPGEREISLFIEDKIAKTAVNIKIKINMYCADFFGILFCCFLICLSLQPNLYSFHNRIKHAL